MQERYEEIRRLGAEVLVVSFSPPVRVAAFLQRYPIPFPAVADPTREAYRTFGLPRASWRDIFHPAVVFRYVKLALRGWLPRKPDQDDDIWQLGGDFIVDRKRRLIYAYPSANPTDRPRVQEMIEVLRARQLIGKLP